jgi:hypothetical protein
LISFTSFDFADFLGVLFYPVEQQFGMRLLGNERRAPLGQFADSVFAQVHRLRQFFCIQESEVDQLVRFHLPSNFRAARRGLISTLAANLAMSSSSGQHMSGDLSSGARAKRQSKVDHSNWIDLVGLREGQQTKAEDWAQIHFSKRVSVRDNVQLYWFHVREKASSRDRSKHQFS